MILVDLVGVSVARPGKQLFEDLNLTISSGERLGIVGINGCGKSTLLSVIAQKRDPESGSVRYGSGVGIAVLEQNPHLVGATVHEAAGGSWESDAILDRLGMGPYLERSLDDLSGGQVKRVALAAALVADSDLLILDEPTNHLDIDAIAWLEERLARYRGTLVMVTHDRHVLDRVTNRVLELDRGKAYVHEGGYDAYLDGKAVREEHAVKAESTRKNLARRELAWLRRGAPARTSKPKARIATATAIVEGSAEAAARSGELPLHLGTPRLGDQVLDLEGLGHTYDGEHWLFRDVDLLIDNRERLGVVGANGTGKSTMLDIIAKRVQPAAGRVVQGSTVTLGYYDQVGKELDGSMRVRDAVTGPHRTADHHDKALMEAFWFGDDAQWAPVELLSGGERRRLQLLMVLAEKPNVLLLDEPTNDLDLDTLRMLEDFLDEWPGALLVVSHDRAFLERTVADVIVLDGQGTAGRVAGGYGAYEEGRKLAPKRRGSIAQTASTSTGSKKGSPKSQSSSKSQGESKGAAQPVQKKSSTSSGRSPSTLRHKLSAVEKLQKRLDKQHVELTTELSTAGADHQRITEIGAELGRVSTEIGRAEEEWLELSAELEERGLRTD